MINKKLENAPKDPRIIEPVESGKQMQHFPIETILKASETKERLTLKHRVKGLKVQGRETYKKHYFIDLDSRSQRKRNEILMTHSVLFAFTQVIFAHFLSLLSASL